MKPLVLIHLHLPAFLSAVGVVLLLSNRHAKQKYIKLLGVLLFTYALLHLTMFLLFIYFRISPNYIATLATMIEFPLISAVFYEVTTRKKTPFIIISVMFTLLALCNFLFIQKEQINSYTMTLESVIIILYCIFYYFWLLKELPTERLHRLPMFWINSGWLIASSGYLFLYLFTAYLVNVLKSNLDIWVLHNIFKIVETGVFVFSIWVYNNERRVAEAA